MAREKYKAEQIIAKLREAEVGLAKGLKTPQVVCRARCPGAAQPIPLDSAPLQQLESVVALT